MATYNKWMNEKIYQAAGKLSNTALKEDRSAFFHSIFGTLNHLMVGDIIWLKRFATHPSSAAALQKVSQLTQPRSLDQILFDDFSQLHKQRRWLDEEILVWISSLKEIDLKGTLRYHNMKAIPAEKPHALLIFHFFNHQTHHRGQLSTLLFQAGEEIGATDLIEIIPNKLPKEY